MDQSTLVAGGQALVRELAKIGFPPRVAMWVHFAETDTWKLWIVPAAPITDMRQFYRQVAEIVTKHRADLGGIDASDTEMIPETHPAMKGLRRFLRASGLTSVHFPGNRFNGYYLPDGIILRSAL